MSAGTKAASKGTKAVTADSRGRGRGSAIARRTRSSELGQRVRMLREAAGLTLKALSLRSGISTSALSKIENGQLSPTYEYLVRVARGFEVDIVELFADKAFQHVNGRRSITKKGGGLHYETANYDYEILASDLSRKQMVPLLATVKAGSIQEFGPMIAHEGEEVLYVLSGHIILYTEYYEPIALKAGDCAYFDSKMLHACVAEGVEDARVFWVCTNTQVSSIFNEPGLKPVEALVSTMSEEARPKVARSKKIAGKT
jgi:transcriptional regulator with XRE-family HTH domain